MVLYLLIPLIFSKVAPNEYTGMADDHKLDLQWDAYKMNYNKFYPSYDEEAFRKGVFAQNLELINFNNELYRDGYVPFPMAVNSYTDLTRDEYQKMHSSQGDILGDTLSYPREWLQSKMKQSRNS